DMGVLKKCLQGYGIEWRPQVRGLCTVMAGRKLLPGMSHSLNVLCEHYGIALDHHQAASDSHACAEILLRYIESGADVSRFIRTYRLR
ncbi:MAG: exonuclease, partial [Ruminococcus sp.]|nr:exonuclease [Ruminococcus sp.]